MTDALMTVHPVSRFSLRDWFDGLFRREPFFAGAGLLMIALMAPTLLAMALDSRTLLDVNVWDKPLKFQVALAVLMLSYAWYSKWLPQGMIEKRTYRIYSAIVVFCVISEMAWLMGAATFCIASHFNRTDPFMAAIYPVMGLFAVILLSPTLVYGVAIWRNDTNGLTPAMRTALGLGLILTFVLTLIFAGYLSSGAGHFVGGNLSDAEGAPVMGWARDGGDLRVAHFFATHAMHFIPAAGLLATITLPDSRAKAVIYMASAGFTAFVIFTFAQALMDRPFIG